MYREEPVIRKGKPFDPGFRNGSRGRRNKLRTLRDAFKAPGVLMDIDNTTPLDPDRPENCNAGKPATLKAPRF